MPVRLIQPYNGQAANTTYWTTAAEELSMRSTGIADDRIELASDYEASGRIITAAAANVSRNAMVYNMMSASVQTLTIPITGYYPVGTVITVIQWGTAKTTIVGAAGVTVTAGNGNTTLVTGGQNYVAQLIKAVGETWIAVGGLSG